MLTVAMPPHPSQSGLHPKGSDMSATTRLATRFRMRFVYYPIVFTALSMSISAQAQTVAFGSRNLNMPAPEGFVAISKTAPRFLEASEGYLSPGTRLVESYVAADDAKALAAGQSAGLARYFQLQTARKADGVPLSADDFRAASTEIEAKIGKVLSEVDVGRLSETGNAQAKKLTATDPQVAISGVESLGAFRHEPWGVFFTAKSHVAVGGASEGSDLICAGALVLINHQLMYLNGYARMHSAEDRRWVEQSVSAWADMVHAANPDDLALAARRRSFGSFSWKELRDTTLVGAALGLLVGIVIAALRKRGDGAGPDRD